MNELPCLRRLQGPDESEERHALLAELLLPMSKQGAALQLGADAVLRIMPDNGGADVQAEAGLCITPILPDTHLHRGEDGGAIGQGAVIIIGTTRQFERSLQQSRLAHPPSLPSGSGHVSGWRESCLGLLPLRVA
ncbi:MAG: hypothetical protein OXF25_00810 [Cyanobacteria bacterium MAG CAR3_bin_5]|nr:hypothetical protein [Cyanobacteria bacterium MAG CAR3_bin_5]